MSHSLCWVTFFNFSVSEVVNVVITQHCAPAHRTRLRVIKFWICVLCKCKRSCSHLICVICDNFFVNLWIIFHVVTFGNGWQSLGIVSCLECSGTWLLILVVMLDWFQQRNLLNLILLDIQFYMMKFHLLEVQLHMVKFHLLEIHLVHLTNFCWSGIVSVHLLKFCQSEIWPEIQNKYCNVMIWLKMIHLRLSQKWRWSFMKLPKLVNVWTLFSSIWTIFEIVSAPFVRRERERGDHRVNKDVAISKATSPAHSFMESMESDYRPQRVSGQHGWQRTLCFHCKAPGHFACECPNLSAPGRADMDLNWRHSMKSRNR